MGHGHDPPTAASHPFYRRLNQLLREHGVDAFVETQCAGFYAETIGIVHKRRGFRYFSLNARHSVAEMEEI